MIERQLKARLQYLEHDCSGDYYYDVVLLKNGNVIRGDIVNRDSFPNGRVRIATTTGAARSVQVDEIEAVA